MLYLKSNVANCLIVVKLVSKFLFSCTKFFFHWQQPSTIQKALLFWLEMVYRLSSIKPEIKSYIDGSIFTVLNLMLSIFNFNILLQILYFIFLSKLYHIKKCNEYLYEVPYRYSQISSSFTPVCHTNIVIFYLGEHCYRQISLYNMFCYQISSIIQTN